MNDLKTNQRKPCKWRCGRELLPAGKIQHEKFCPRRPDHHQIAAAHIAQFKSKNHPKKVPDLGPTEVIYGLFKDAALFGAVSHIFKAQDGENVIVELTQAKKMIDLKINSLNG